jgi:site-specific DNA-adenine methylase
MKTFIILTILSTLLFAATMDNDYEKFNLNLEKISSKISTEKKIELYLLALSTQNSILLSTPCDDLQDKMLLSLSTLKQNKKLTKSEIDKLEKSYLAMIEYTQRQIYKNDLYILAVFIGVMIGLFIGYFRFRKKSSKVELQSIRVEHSDKDKKIIKDLQDLNNKLKKEINLLKLSI